MISLASFIIQPSNLICSINDTVIAIIVTGLRQSLSCVLFNIALEVVIKRALIDTGGTIFSKSVQSLGFANVFDIIARIDIDDSINMHQTESKSLVKWLKRRQLGLFYILDQVMLVKK